MRKATAQLKSGLELFVPPATAQCSLVSANVATAKEEHHDGESDDDHEGEHMEFHAEYSLKCNTPEKLNHLRFDFFKKFPSTQVLEVMIISDKGQRVYNITAANPVADMLNQ